MSQSGFLLFMLLYSQFVDVELKRWMIKRSFIGVADQQDESYFEIKAR